MGDVGGAMAGFKSIYMKGLQGAAADAFKNCGFAPCIAVGSFRVLLPALQ